MLFAETQAEEDTTAPTDAAPSFEHGHQRSFHHCGS